MRRTVSAITSILRGAESVFLLPEALLPDTGEDLIEYYVCLGQIITIISIMLVFMYFLRSTFIVISIIFILLPHLLRRIINKIVL